MAKEITPAMRKATRATIQKVLRLRESAGVVLTPKERTMLGRCFFQGCENAPTNKATKRWGDNGSFHVCDQHTPKQTGNLPMCYDVEPIKGDDK